MFTNIFFSITLYSFSLNIFQNCFHLGSFSFLVNSCFIVFFSMILLVTNFLNFCLTEMLHYTFSFEWYRLSFSLELWSYHSFFLPSLYFFLLKKLPYLLFFVFLCISLRYVHHDISKYVLLSLYMFYFIFILLGVCTASWFSDFKYFSSFDNLLTIIT